MLRCAFYAFCKTETGTRATHLNASNQHQLRQIPHNIYESIKEHSDSPSSGSCLLINRTKIYNMLASLSLRHILSVNEWVWFIRMYKDIEVSQCPDLSPVASHPPSPRAPLIWRTQADTRIQNTGLENSTAPFCYRSSLFVAESWYLEIDW